MTLLDFYLNPINQSDRLILNGEWYNCAWCSMNSIVVMAVVSTLISIQSISTASIDDIKYDTEHAQVTIGL